MQLQGRMVLVTGADGFIGSHLVEALLRRGCRVRAFVFYNAFNSWGWLDTMPQDSAREMEVVAGDVRDPHAVANAMEGCDVVFHLAALIAIPFSYHSPDSYVDTNIRGSLNVLQAARRLGDVRVLMTSTSEVYGTAQYVPIHEGHPLQGQSPYSATKIAADKLAESFFRSFDTPVIIARPFNTYGPRQSARAILPTIITQLLSGARSISLGNLSPTRDFNFVEDTVAGMVALAECDSAIGQEVNIATGIERSIGELAALLVALLQPDAKVVTDDQRLRPDASEVLRLVGDSRKLKALTGWQPSHDLESGLRKTIAWFREPANLRRYKTALYNL